MRKLVFIVIGLFALFVFIQSYTSLRAAEVPASTASLSRPG